MQRSLDLDPRAVAAVAAAALAEDIGSGDVTTQATISGTASCEAHLRTRQPGVVAGLPVAIAAFRQLDPTLEIVELGHDGDRIAPGDHLLTIAGQARAVLTA